MARNNVELIRSITARYGTTVPVTAAKEIAFALRCRHAELRQAEAVAEAHRDDSQPLNAPHPAPCRWPANPACTCPDMPTTPPTDRKA